jgi:hypothetical protein
MECEHRETEIIIYERPCKGCENSFFPKLPMQWYCEPCRANGSKGVVFVWNFHGHGRTKPRKRGKTAC